jgi:mono/diheme cytochrome c family protein
MNSIARLLAAIGLAACATVSAASAQPAMSQGEYVARASNCVACHSVEGGQAFAGGLKMATPVGAIYATNITPDKETGIGNYTLEDFDRAVRRGVAKDGHHLYPAMPYPSYAKMSEADIAAMYDFFMKEVKPVRQPNLPGEAKWPLNSRWPLAIWNVVFADFDRYEPKTGKDADWNRGAYLVQGPGHCGACHTPRGFASQEASLDESGSSFLTGGNLDHWMASNLTGDQNIGLGRWSEDELFHLLKTGRNKHAAVAGTMIEVVNNSTQYLTDADLKAMAKYLKSLPPQMEKGKAAWAYDQKTTDDLRKRTFTKAGAAIYMRDCASCHAVDGKGRASYLPAIAGNPGVVQTDAASVINLVLNGSNRLVISGVPDMYRMPQYRLTLDDQEVADVVNFVRTSWGAQSSTVTPAQVKKIREETDPSTDRPIVLRMK